MYSAAIFLPLLGAVLAGLFGRQLGDRWSQIVPTALLFVSAALSIPILYTVVLAENAGPVTIDVARWISSGTLEAGWTLRFDALSAVMVFVVTVISAIVHLYSIGYMEHDPHRPRFFAYLSLFTFAMLMLVTADNLVQMFFGWEGVGLCSYLLIGFWYHKPEANAAAIKAFIVNRVGDFGFMLGIVGIYLLFDAVALEVIFANVGNYADAQWSFLDIQADAIETVCILLFIGAMGKSGQLLLHTWLPDAMEGPTPVSALIHAATMVTAGVFMVCRLAPLFEAAPTALFIVTLVGASTAFFAATIGLAQNDIKRVVAYSTVSQLGYMFFAAGLSAYPVAIFHLMTHAFFKALLFLGAGSVIHGMSGEQDMRRMGGIWRQMPWTYAVMWAGALSLAGIGIPGIFGFAGFYSKDLILEVAHGAGTGIGQYAFWLGIAAAFLTALYSWRLLLMTFHGTPRADEEVMAHIHESPWVIRLPLVLLALGAVFAGIVGYEALVGHDFAAFWGQSMPLAPVGEALERAHAVPTWVLWLPLVAALGGILAAYVGYLWVPDLPALLAQRLRPVYLFLYNKWYFDELYDWLFVRPAGIIGRGLWKSGDGAVIDGVGPDGVAATTIDMARRIASLQSGYIYHYAFAVLIGVVAFVTLYLFGVWG